MWKARAARLALAVIVAAALGACGPAQPERDGRLAVVATFSVIGDFVQQVGGDRVTLRTLVGPGGDAHTFEPTPEDGRALAGARVLFEEGLGFEPWLEKLYQASGSRAARVVVSQGVAPLTLSADGRSEADPHIWHDVNNAIHMVEQIEAGLAAADPAGAAIYRANADRYLAQLRELDAFVLQQVATLPEARRKLVTSHDTLGYFAARYGFTIIGTGLGSVSTEVADPSPATLAALVRAIRAAGVPVIFAENVSNPQIMQTIAREAGVRLAPTLYTDALGEPGSSGATYLTMMRANVTTIVTSLRDG